MIINKNSSRKIQQSKIKGHKSLKRFPRIVAINGRENIFAKQKKNLIIAYNCVISFLLHISLSPVVNSDQQHFTRPKYKQKERITLCTQHALSSFQHFIDKSSLTSPHYCLLTCENHLIMLNDMRIDR